MRYLLAALLLVASCTSQPLGGVQGGTEGCAKDTDCKGARVCVGGECVEPADAGTPPDIAPPIDLVHHDGACFPNGGECRTAADCCTGACVCNDAPHFVNGACTGRATCLHPG